MNRTTIVACVASFLCVAAVPKPARPPFRIGLLSDTTYFSDAPVTHWDDAEQLAGLRQGMADVGVKEGKDWILIPKLANRDHRLLDKYAAELAAMNVDAIAASSTTAGIAARHATQSIPIVTWGADLRAVLPIGDGSNVTGLQGADQIEDYVAQLKAFVPDLKRLAVLYDASYVVVPPLVEKTRAAGEAAALELTFIEVSDTEALGPAFERMARAKAQALLVLNHPRFHLHPEEVTALALKYRLPMASPYRETADAGGLIAHHPDWPTIWREGAKTIKRILDGTPPSGIPIQPGAMRTFINVNTAKTLGLIIPVSLREHAKLIDGAASVAK